MPLPDRNIAADVSDMPDDVRQDIRAGFAVATALTGEMLERFIDVYLQGFQRGGATLDLDPLVELAGKPRSDIIDLVAAVSVLVGLLSKGPISENDLEVLMREKLFDEADARAVSAITKRIGQQQPGLKKMFDRRSLAVETLPSLTGFNLSIDLRLRFTKDEVTEGVAVALIHIRTDAEPELWLQLSRGDVDAIAEKLRETSRRMELAENLFNRVYEDKSK
jgi:hypothetical protein